MSTSYFPKALMQQMLLEINLQHMKDLQDDID